MKNNLLKTILMLSKCFLYGLVLQTLLLNLVVALDANGQYKKIEEVTIAISTETLTVQQFFREVQRQTPFKFSYENQDVDRNLVLKFDRRTGQLISFLQDAAKQSDLNFRQVNHGIDVIKRKNSQAVSVQLTNAVDIRGVVRDENGDPLPGVTVLIEGTSTGTATDIDGRYSISATEGSILVFSFVGFVTQRRVVGTSDTIDVRMVEDASSLDEVVVIGYGTREKKDLTGAISQIGAEEITRTAAMSPELSMQGRMAGVFVSNPGSNPNARPQIRIRGVSTLGFNDPLFVIDGVPLYEGGAPRGDNSRVQDLRGGLNVFNMINPNDIESISVLKDAAATAIYGVRASNGVVLITTKRGAKGKPKVDVSARFGIQNVRPDWEVMGVQDYVQTYLEALNANPNAAPDPNFFRFYDINDPSYLGNSPFTTGEWQRAARNPNAPIQDYNVTVSGGTEMSNYSVGAGYADQENAMFYSRFKRYSAFANSDHQITNWLKVGESFRFIYSETDDIGGGDLNTAFNVPWQPIYDPNGFRGYAEPGRTFGNQFLSNGYGNGTRSHFLGIADLNTVTRNVLRNIGSFYAEATPIDGLRFRGSISFDYSQNVQERFHDARRGIFEANFGQVYDQEGNTFRRRVNENINVVKEFLIGYDKTFGNHRFDLILNAMDQKIQWNNTQMSIDRNSILPDYDQRRIDEGWAQTDKQIFYERTPVALQGYMGRLSYNYSSKYYLDATLRRDGSSNFAPGYKWGTFPGLAAAWRISSEPFMQGVGLVNDLKVRAGWGVAGNQETRAFAFLSLVNFNPVYHLGVGATGVGDGIRYPAMALGDFPILDMSWETVTTRNLGVDMLMLDNKLSLTVEYYDRFTDGILQAINIPQVIGALTQPVVNLASISNRGFEMQVGYQDRIGELGYNVAANLTTVRNRVSNLYRNQPQGGNTNRIENGRSLNFLWGYITDGIFQNEEEVNAWTSQYDDPGRMVLKAPGDVRFVDIQGPPTADDGELALYSPNPDGVINAFDQTYLGKTIPGYFYGINLGANYKNFDFSIDFRGTGDVQGFFTSDRNSVGAGGGNFLVDILDRWTPSNPSNTIPRAIHNDPSGNNRMSDRHVVSRSFFRFQNFQVGYTLKGNVLQRLGVSNLRTYLMGQNMFVFSPFPGLDPENDTTPTSFIFGVNLGF